MKLPDHAFDRIRRALDLPATPEGGAGGSARRESADVEAPAERREPRWRLSANVPFSRHGAVNGILRTVSLRDVSAVGVCIVTDQHLTTGDRFVVYLPWGGGEHVPLVCVVKTARVKTDGTFRLGAAFVEANDAILRQRNRVRSSNALMGEAESGQWARVSREPGRPNGNRKPRRHERRQTGGAATIYTYEPGDKRGPLEQVQVRDYSDGGVAILRGEPLEPGRRFIIHLPLPGATPVTRLCRVVHVTLSHDRYLIGGEFEPLPNEYLDPGLTRRIRRWLGVEK